MAKVGSGEAFPFPTSASPSSNFIRTKLIISKRKVGILLLLSLFIYPFLCGIVLLSIWGDERNQHFALPGDIVYILKSINNYLVVAFLILGVVSHILELLLMLAIATDNLRFCKTYITTVAPLLWTLTIITFGLMMWSGLKPLENNALAKFIIVSGSSIILVANFFNYYLKTVAEHTGYLSILRMMYEPIEIEYV